MQNETIEMNGTTYRAIHSARDGSILLKPEPKSPRGLIWLGNTDPYDYWISFDDGITALYDGDHVEGVNSPQEEWPELQWDCLGKHEEVFIRRDEVQELLKKSLQDSDDAAMRGGGYSSLIRSIKTILVNIQTQNP